MSQTDGGAPRRPPSTPRVDDPVIPHSQPSPRGGQGPAGRTCQVCGGGLAIGPVFVRDGSQHYEAGCTECGRDGLLTDEDPDADTGMRTFGAVFQAGERPRAIASMQPTATDDRPQRARGRNGGET